MTTEPTNAELAESLDRVALSYEEEQRFPVTVRNLRLAATRLRSDPPVDSVLAADAFLPDGSINPKYLDPTTVRARALEEAAPETSFVRARVFESEALRLASDMRRYIHDTTPDRRHKCIERFEKIIRALAGKEPS